MSGGTFTLAGGFWNDGVEPQPTCPADVAPPPNGDGFVNIFDLLFVVANWGGGAGRCGEHVVGLQIGGKWTEGTGFTENGVIVDGKLTKLGSELRWTYDWDRPLEPWRVEDPGGQLSLTLSPRYDKHSKVGDDDAGSETHQVFGTWSGSLTTDDGLQLEFDGIQGFAEEARQRW